MTTRFYIVLSMQTINGPESFANFQVGNNGEHAYEIFAKLEGTPEVDEKSVLFLDLMETHDGLPLNIKMITCSLDQLSKNCKIITRELFKLNNLNGQDGP